MRFYLLAWLYSHLDRLPGRRPRAWTPDRAHMRNLARANRARWHQQAEIDEGCRRLWAEINKIREEAGER